MDEEKFTELVRTHQNLIYKVCRTYCQDEDDREDLQQEILIRIWKSIGSFDGRAKVSTWIYRVAINTAISFYRKDSRIKGLRSSVDISAISLPEDEQEQIRNERISILYQFIEQLNELDKALMLLYLDQKKQKEIAEILGISESNVGTKINRIKQAFKKQVNQPKKENYGIG